MVAGLDEVAEFKPRDLMDISILQTDKFFAKYLKFRIANTKHLKRKNAHEKLLALKFISGYSQERSRFNFLSRFKDSDRGLFR